MDQTLHYKVKSCVGGNQILSNKCSMYLLIIKCENVQTVQQHYAGIPSTALAFDKIDDMRSQEAQFYGSFSATYTHCL